MVDVRWQDVRVDHVTLDGADCLEHRMEITRLRM